MRDLGTIGHGGPETGITSASSLCMVTVSPQKQLMVVHAALRALGALSKCSILTLMFFRAHSSATSATSPFAAAAAASSCAPFIALLDMFRVIGAGPLGVDATL